MPARTRLAAVACAAAAALTYAAPAHALLPQQVVAYSGGFVSPEVHVVQGDTLTLTNADATAFHDLRSRDTLGGKPLFRAVVTAGGARSEVEGVASLPPSVYPFYCSVHEYMVGNLTVEASPVGVA